MLPKIEPIFADGEVPPEFIIHDHKYELCRVVSDSGIANDPVRYRLTTDHEYKCLCGKVK